LLAARRSSPGWRCAMCTCAAILFVTRRRHQGEGAMRHRNARRMKAIALRAILAAVCGVGLIFSLAAAAAGMRVLDADDMPRLDADEGLLLVTLDTEFPLEAVYMKQEGAVLNSRVLKNVVA